MNDSTWTWISGSDTSNAEGSESVPSARSAAIGWFDSIKQELWLFGGQIFDSVFYNELWRYQVNGDVWTKISGSGGDYPPGVYGQKGETTPGSIPGGRYNAAGWYDSTNQEFWMFGGYGVDSVNARGASSFYHLKHQIT